MARVPRTPVNTLLPLNQRQLDYLMYIGETAAAAVSKRTIVWWKQYFADVNDGPLPDDAWEDPGFDVSNKVAYVRFLEKLQSDLRLARSSVTAQRSLQAQKLFPPMPEKDPFTLPAYFGWWQSENAFRRGFVKFYDTHFLRTLKDEVKSEFRDNGNIFTIDTMRELAKEYDQDPFVAKFYTELADATEQGQTPYTSLKACWDDMIKRRAVAYEQFSPYFTPLRWVRGAGLVGIDQE